MRKLEVFFGLIFLALTANAQTSLSEDHFDFGIVKRGSERMLEKQIVNSNEETITLLRVEAVSKEYDVRSDIRQLASGDTMRVRLKLNPLSKGTRDDELKLFFNNGTLTFNVLADIRYVDPADNTPCPDFEKAQAMKESDWEALFKVIDRDSKEPIANAEIILTGKAGSSMKYLTDKKGELLTGLPIDFYTIKASANGYAKYAMESYINRRNKDFTLELMPGKMGSVVVWKPGQKEEPENEMEDLVIEVKEVEEKVKEPIIVPEPEEIEEEFSIKTYRENNAVFLIDISTSMRKEDRIELLKSSMIELASMLRPEDLISIVTYATSTDIVLSGEHVADVQRITAVIESLEAEGKTAGEAGLKQAYKICQRYFIDGGNNHVYLATDGAFNKGSEKIKKLVSSKARKDMHLSVLSIRSSRWVDEKMQDLAVAGNGQHLSIQEEEDQGSLKDLVKEQSRR